MELATRGDYADYECCVPYAQGRDAGGQDPVEVAEEARGYAGGVQPEAAAEGAI